MTWTGWSVGLKPEYCTTDEIFRANEKEYFRLSGPILLGGKSWACSSLEREQARKRRKCGFPSEQSS